MRLVAAVDRVWLAARRAKGSGGGSVTAGAGIQGDRRLECTEAEGVWWPQFPTLAHSFWRAQEVTLFRRHVEMVTEPVLDLGCGDGIFGELADFPATTTGADFDRPSLEIRKRVLPGARSEWADAGALPFKDGEFATVVSNSVFEHLPDLGACFRELHRVLRPGGRLLFTMTLGEFTSQLRQLSGERDAAFWISNFGHHQQPTAAEVIQLLEKTGFHVRTAKEYQPISATEEYRKLVSPVQQFLERRRSPERIGSQISLLRRRAAASLDEPMTGAGACLWVVADKRLP